MNPYKPYFSALGAEFEIYPQYIMEDIFLEKGKTSKYKGTIKIKNFRKKARAAKKARAKNRKK